MRRLLQLSRAAPTDGWRCGVMLFAAKAAIEPTNRALRKTSAFQIGCNEWDSLIDLPAVAVKQPAEFFARSASDLRARRVGGRKLVAPVKRLAGVDQRHRMRHVADRAPLRRQRGIGAGIPRASDELDRFLRIGAREHGPQQMV